MAGLTMVNLDNPLIYRQIDRAGMLNHLHEFSEQCQRAWQKVGKFELPREYSKVDKVIILGMGGSAIGGDIVRRLALAESKVPVWMHRDYGLPPFVDDRTLVIASSYSGNTEETLSAFTESLKTPAKKLVLTTGGRLKELAEKEGIPAFVIDYKAPPRAAFPHNFIPLVGIFQTLGLLRDKSVNLGEALKILRKLSRDFSEITPLVSNPAKQLATKVWGHVAVIYGAGILGGVAQRWKTQFNENSKTWAFFELFPELNHNSVLGYKFPSEAKEGIFVLLLRSPLLHPRSLLHYEATAKLLAKAGISHDFVEAPGTSALAQMLSLVFLGDYLSFYLAILNSIDPTPMEHIDFVKRYLAQFAAASD
ncbi:MAG: bifunctional phosphoglucose/phosphomannose isomerase [Dehalococcoidales bacterium]|jgi:glucose/mannose-6-phosphate isomerase|nr:bifunctional phosphoglucose/phosphomannose isomerase [Dehalococcoidales bacterium]|tara:strand:- start:1358 stop:2449 length:1092 start_codon:yes stop_codon:yes gene_type:complete